ncbi:hypothetical protein RRG08_039683 [Elysia crispata]|uniref:Uncharacterized protein n=1 Tax=Elysia crispata TaxID=231223 RepID=A0AAE0YAD7_9GAST|nr:hypothetical protein RRG08_039683 [Elysia crispata]
MFHITTFTTALCYSIIATVNYIIITTSHGNMRHYLNFSRVLCGLVTLTDLDLPLLYKPVSKETLATLAVPPRLYLLAGITLSLIFEVNLGSVSFFLKKWVIGVVLLKV